MEISLWLPNEILVQIIQQSPNADQATLLRVSKLFRDLCLPVLYRIVNLRPIRVDSVASFCSGIIGNSSRAEAVRSFTLKAPWNRCTERRSDLLLAPLKLMSNLTHLSISGLDDQPTCILLEECHFPQLINCEIWAPLGNVHGFLPKPSDSIAVFFAHHSTIKRVQLHSSTWFASQLGRISMPNLESYEGDPNLIHAIDDATGLKAVKLSWRPRDERPVDKILLRIRSMTKLDLPFVFSHEFLNEPFEIVTSVSKHMPHTRTLRLYSYFAPIGHDTIRHITDCLPMFTDLVHLAIEYGNSFGSPNKNSDEDRVVVEQWGKACPTLEACSLNDGAWRKVDGRWEDYPEKEV
ncbi:hypothetical protein C8R45DRAFT_965108 [Mycena sanguinolenta]|nr:hypothetical protein C8R45DRAFT_965108 [Mycena sanguinolenta]